MPLKPIKSCNKYLLSYKDSLNNIHQINFYARDSYDFLPLPKEFNSHLNHDPSSVIRIQQKFWPK